MLPSTFEFILNEISNNLIRTTDGNNKMIPPDKQLLLSLWHNLIFKSIKQLNFWHFYSETDQNCVGKEFVVSCRNKRNLNNTLFPALFIIQKNASVVLPLRL